MPIGRPPGTRRYWTFEVFAETLKVIESLIRKPCAVRRYHSGGTYLLVLIADYGGLPLDFRTNRRRSTLQPRRQSARYSRRLISPKMATSSMERSANLVGRSEVHPDNTTAFTETLNGFSAVKKFKGR